MRLLLPQTICHRFKLHKWFYKSRNKALISKECSRCAMSGIMYGRKLKLEEMKRNDNVPRRPSIR